MRFLNPVGTELSRCRFLPGRTVISGLARPARNCTANVGVALLFDFGSGVQVIASNFNAKAQGRGDAKSFDHELRRTKPPCGWLISIGPLGRGIPELPSRLPIKWDRRSFLSGTRPQWRHGRADPGYWPGGAQRRSRRRVKARGWGNWGRRSCRSVSRAPQLRRFCAGVD
jgi:hypothetical protein